MLHALATTALNKEAGPPFKRGAPGPRRWLFLYGPELHVGCNVLVSELADWRRETPPQIPDAPFISVRADCLAEVPSESTRQHDRARRLQLYAQAGVTHVWLVAPQAQTLEVFSCVARVIAYSQSKPEARACEPNRCHPAAARV